MSPLRYRQVACGEIGWARRRVLDPAGVSVALALLSSYWLHEKAYRTGGRGLGGPIPPSISARGPVGLAAVARTEPRRFMHRNRAAEGVAPARPAPALESPRPGRGFLRRVGRRPAHLHHGRTARGQPRRCPQPRGRQGSLVNPARQSRCAGLGRLRRSAGHAHSRRQPRLCPGSVWRGELRQRSGRQGGLAQTSHHRLRRTASGMGLFGISTGGRRSGPLHARGAARHTGRSEQEDRGVDLAKQGLDR